MTEDPSDTQPLIIEGDAMSVVVDQGRGLVLAIDPGHDDEVFIRLQSWRNDSARTALLPFAGRRLRVTVEIVE
jgi:hypothetical protein